MKPHYFLSCAAMALLTLTASLSVKAQTARHRRAAPPPDSALIINNSGGVNDPGYRIRVTANGRLSSVTLLAPGRTSGGRTGQLTPAVTRRFFSDLAAAAPLDQVPFGMETGKPPLTAPNIRITVRYHGLQSPNLREAESPAGQTLYADVAQIVQALRLPIPNTP